MRDLLRNISCLIEPKVPSDELAWQVFEKGDVLYKGIQALSIMLHSFRLGKIIP